MPADTLTPPAAAGAVKQLHYAFAFELTGARNENMLCPLDHHVCRGRWDRKYLIGQTPDEQFQEMPIIPGLVFIINTKKKEVRRFDPLVLPQNAQLLKLAQKTGAAIFGTIFTPERQRTWKDCDDGFLKSAVWWWWKLMGMKRANIVKGTHYPKSVDDIKAMPGFVRGEVFNQSGHVDRDVPNEKLIWRAPSEDDYANRQDLTAAELPDPLIDIPNDPAAYMMPAHMVGMAGPNNPYAHPLAGGRSAADILASVGAGIGAAGGGGLDLFGTGGDEPDVAERL